MQRVTTPQHEPTRHAGKVPTCTEIGWEDHCECSRCGKFFEDEAGTTEISHLNTWKTGDGKLDQAAHIYDDWTVVTPATQTSDGQKKHSCTVCGHEETEVIPKLGPATITFKVVNGTWDGTDTANKTEEVTLTNGKGTWSAAQIPTGMQP